MSIQRIIGVDPGSESSGVCILDGETIVAAFDVKNSLFFTKVSDFLLHMDCTVAVEAIRPYSLRLTPQVVDTCQWIGELKFRLINGCGDIVEMIPRNVIKKWVFDTFPEMAIPEIDKKIAKKGGDRKASFVYVDDRIVTLAMKIMYHLETPKPGYGYAHGLKSHSFQALAIASHVRAKSLILETSEGHHD